MHYETPDIECRQFEIVIDGPFHRTASGPVIGVVYIHAGDFDFPETGWRDFVAVLLDAWSTAVLKLSYNGAKAAFMFMDGPFNVQLTREGSTVLASFTPETFIARSWSTSLLFH